VREQWKSRSGPEMRWENENFAVRKRSIAHLDRLLGASAVEPNENNAAATGAEGGRKEGFNAWIMSTGFNFEDCRDLWSLTECIYVKLSAYPKQKKIEQIIRNIAHLDIVANGIKKQHSDST